VAYEAKPNTGSLFRNDNRTQDTHAHARGSAVIDGIEYYVDAWTNIDKSGNKYQSLKFKQKQPKPTATKQEPRYGDDKREGAALDRDLDSDTIPF
jgi:hypothetical protein